ncbi:MAG: AmpG family muropeptide MFS transporter [Pseudomonadales bacterium]
MTDPTADGTPPPTLRAAFAQPASLTLLAFGFASGLPFLLVGGTLSAWLKESGVSLEEIGLLSLVGLAYSLKFLWAPVVDRVGIPILARLGQRRGWLFAAQAVLVLALLAMAFVTPGGHLTLFVIVTVVAAFAGATQDVVVDAYRIEIAPPSVQGALAATYMLGYRLALLVSGALALLLADQMSWTRVYVVMAAAMSVTLLATLLAPEPAAARTRERMSWRGGLVDGVVGPFRDFFRRYAGWLGVALLLFVGLIKVPDQLLGVMAIPFYLDSGFSKTEIAAVSKVFGIWMGIAGAFLGGAVVVRLGVTRALLVAVIIGAVSNLLFILLALWPGDLVLFTLVIGGENAAGGFLGAAAVAWLSALVDRQYTATQYALFSSLISLPGKLLGGFSGFMVTAAGYVPFFVISTIALLPALLLWGWLRSRVNLDPGSTAPETPVPATIVSSPS